MNENAEGSLPTTPTDVKEFPTTPILVKRSEKLGWPGKEKIFYILARNGLHICRNGEFFKSCIPARSWPAELAPQESYLLPRFPKISRRLFERVVGFFDRIAELHDSEAAVLLVWDRRERRVGVLVPEQKATVHRSWSGKTYPIGVDYFPPTNLPEHLVWFGDIHSHVDLPAYASSVDVRDEDFRAGLHIVVGRIDREPPDLHIEAVADGTRFPLEESAVLGGYQRRRQSFPPSWVDKVEIVERTWTTPSVAAAEVKSGGAAESSWSGAVGGERA